MYIYFDIYSRDLSKYIYIYRYTNSLAYTVTKLTLSGWPLAFSLSEEETLVARQCVPPYLDLGGYKFSQAAPIIQKMGFI